LTIANGHTMDCHDLADKAGFDLFFHVDAMRFVTGDIRRLFAVVATQAKQWLGGRHNKAKMAELNRQRLVPIREPRPSPLPSSTDH
jgi:hypothetical protein